MDAAFHSPDTGSADSSAANTQPGTFARRFGLRSTRGLKVAGWILVFFGCLMAFTAVKFPETRVKSLILGQINAALAPRGIAISPETSHIGLGLGVSLVLENVRVSFPAPTPSITIDRLRVRPSILPLLFKKISTGIDLKQGEGSLDLHVSLPMQPAQDGSSPVAFEYDVRELNLAAAGVGPLLGGVPLFGVLSGDGSFAGDLNAPETWQGEASIHFSRLRADAQQVAGFQIPSLSIGELDGDFSIDSDRKKIVINRFQFGKAGGSDDLVGSLTGDAALSGRNAGQLPLSVTAKFTLSDRVRRELVLLDAILGPGKQSDGSYAYKIGGTLSSPFPTPIPAAGAPAPGAGEGGGPAGP